MLLIGKHLEIYAFNWEILGNKCLQSENTGKSILPTGKNYNNIIYMLQIG